MKTFKHSGDLGDIIYSLPVIKDSGGGVLYLDIEGGLSDPHCQSSILEGKTKFNKKSFDFIYPLLKEQEYLEDIKIYNGEKVDINFDEMRTFALKQPPRSANRCLVDSYRQLCSLPEYDVNNPWLSCGEPIMLDRKFVVSRSPRYQGAYVFIASQKKYIEKNGVFIGIKKEHELFEWTFDLSIPFYDTNSALDIAKVILGSNNFMSNSTFNLSVAVGLPDKNIIQEIDRYNQSTLFLNKIKMTRV